MFQIDLKRIETAIKGGRLDEAFDRLLQSPERSHRDGQQLTDKLVDAFGQRAEEHLVDGRLDDAESDADKAIELAGRTTELSALRIRIQDARGEENQHRDRERVLQQSVEDHLLAGQLTLAAKLLPERKESDKLAETMDHQRLVLEDVIAKMDLALDQSDHAEVLRIAQATEPQCIQHPSVRTRLRRALDPLATQAEEEFQAGRLDRAGTLVHAMSSVDIDHPRVAEIAGSIERCRAAQKAFQQGLWLDTDRELGLLTQVSPNLDWLEKTRQSVANIMRAQREIESGPLGLLSNSRPVTAPSKPQPSASVKAIRDESLILQVDGLGGILLLTNDVLTIGAASQSAHLDLPLRTEGPRHPIEIRRSGEDYFAQSEAEFLVNDQPTRRRLLTSNETIQYGRRGRLKFRRPVAASGSAVLQLSGAALPRRDIRYVALMSDSLVFAPSGGHFTLPSAPGPVVLYRVRDHFVVKRPNQNAMERQELAFGDSLLVGETRFSLRHSALC